MEAKLLTWILLLAFLCCDNEKCSSTAQHITKQPSAIEGMYCTKDFECTSSCELYAKVSKRCSCHPACEIFQDCCYNTKDYNNRCSTSDVTVITELILEFIVEHRQYFQCVSDFTSYRKYWMVSKCPKSWNKPNQCDSDDDNIFVGRVEENIASIPVVTDDGITFRNIYCALCHEVDLTRLTPWAFQAEKCRYDNRSLGEKANVTIQGKIQYLTQNCEEVSFLPPPNRTFSSVSAIPCHQATGDVIATCEGSSLSNEITGNCSVITAPIYVDNKLFKNKFCVDCYYSRFDEKEVRLTEICMSDRFGISRTASFGRQPPKTNLVPISITFDFGGQSGGVSITKEENEVEKTSMTCDLGQVFDPLQSMCMHLSCPEGYELRGKFCMQNKTEIFNSSCSHFFLNITFQTRRNILYFCSNYVERTSTCLPEYLTYFLEEKSLEGNISCYMHQNKRTYSLLAQTSSKQLIRNLLLYLNITNTKHSTKLGNTCDFFGMIDVFGYCVSDQNDLQSGCDLQWVNQSQWYLKEETDHIVLKENNEMLSFSQIKFQRQFIFTSGAQTDSKENVLIAQQQCRVNQMCPHIILDSSLFQPVENGSHVLAYVHNKSIQFKPDEYLQYENGSIQVCNFLHTTGKVEYIFLPKYSPLESILSTIGITLSIIALSFSLVTYCMFATLRTRIANILIMHLCFCLIVAQLLLMFSGMATSVAPLCAVIAGLGHFSWLAVFSTSSMLGYALDQTFSLRNQTTRGKRPSSKNIIFSVFICLTGPFIVSGILLILYLINGNDFGITYGTEYGCWIGGPHINLYAFGVPVAVCLLVNLVFFCHVTFSISKQTRSSARIRKGNEKLQIREFVIYVKIFVVLGLTWIVGFVASFTNIQFLWYVFIILTSLQGVFIFLAFTVNSQIWDMWKKRLGLSVGGYSGVSSSTDTEQLKIRNRLSRVTDTSTV